MTRSCACLFFRKRATNYRAFLRRRTSCDHVVLGAGRMQTVMHVCDMTHTYTVSTRLSSQLVDRLHSKRLSPLQHTATHCNTLQHTRLVETVDRLHSKRLSPLQHTATHCNTLQHTRLVEEAELTHATSHVVLYQLLRVSHFPQKSH